MISRGKFSIIGILALFITISPGLAFTITADSLLQLLEEEQVVSPSKAQVIKQKAKEIEKKEAKDIWKAKWDNGLTVYRQDGNFEVTIGGRIHLDFANISSPNRHFIDTLEAIEGDQYTGTGAEFRRARLKVEGLIWNFVEFKAEYDFAEGEDVAFNDVYVGLTKLPYIGTVRVGHQKEPFSLEELTSSNYITFMERALPNVFSPERNTGVLVFNTVFDKRLWWGVGAFLNTDDFGDEFDDFGNWNVSARLVGTPIYQDKGRRLFFIGAAYSHQFRNDNDDDVGVTGPLFFRYRQRPEIHITDARTLDTLDFLANGADVFNAQSALVWGSFSIQGEYFLSAVNATKQANRGLGIVPPFEANPTFQGAYAYVSYFLTGEHRPYSQSSGAFTRVKPIINFDPSRGTWGAFEVAARWSFVTLNSKGVAGGIENNFTFGLNWYLNQNARWMFNYIFADLDKRRNILTPNINDTFAGKSHIVGTRFQVDF